MTITGKWHNWGRSDEVACVGFSLKSDACPIEVIKDQETGKTIKYEGAYGSFRMSGKYDFTLEQAIHLRNILNEFITEAENEND